MISAATVAHAVELDSKIKTLVPTFAATVAFSTGAREVVQWHGSQPELQVVDHGFMDMSETLINWVRRPA
ncbi:hypothetical protein ACHMXB_19380 [Arthrobacter sp. UC242_113]|uniref:hypothetical protein n=1 Tax=Arthrobacter sp. UC242_113 TaxID=3374550 RepID=UPI003757EB10